MRGSALHGQRVRDVGPPCRASGAELGGRLQRAARLRPALVLPVHGRRRHHRCSWKLLQGLATPRMLGGMGHSTCTKLFVGGFRHST